MDNMNANELLRVSKEGKESFAVETLSGELYKHIVYEVETAALEGYTRWRTTFDNDKIREIKIIVGDFESRGFRCKIEEKEYKNLFNVTRYRKYLIIDWGER